MIGLTQNSLRVLLQLYRKLGRMASVDLADPKTFFSQIGTTLRVVKGFESRSGKDPRAGASSHEGRNAAVFRKSLEEFEEVEKSLARDEPPADYERIGLNALSTCLDQALQRNWEFCRVLMQTLADASRERQCWG